MHDMILQQMLLELSTVGLNPTITNVINPQHCAGTCERTDEILLHSPALMREQGSQHGGLIILAPNASLNIRAIKGCYYVHHWY
jgi:hypothetical protein